MRNLRTPLSPSARSRAKINLGVLSRRKKAEKLKDKRRKLNGWKSILKQEKSSRPSYPIQQVKGV